MRTLIARLSAAGCLAIPLAIAACSQAPLAPSAGDAGASISGRVTSGAAAFAATSSVKTPLAVPPANAAAHGLTVTVVGTTISSPVDGSGTFALSNVPAGARKLRFKGDVIDVVTDPVEMADGDEIELDVEIGPSAAVILNERRSDKITLCHATASGKYQVITVDPAAEAAHRTHGDGAIGDPVPNDPSDTFGPGCQTDNPGARPDDSDNGEKVALCHKTGAGKYVAIDVDVDAEPAHRAHGDGEIGDAVPGTPGAQFGPGCSVAGT